MSALLNELKAWGCDTDSVMPRFSHKEDFYARCFKKFVVDPALEALGKALADKDADAAFRQAHTLKGLTENMGLTPLSAILSRIVEPAGKLRSSALDGVSEVYPRSEAV